MNGRPYRIVSAWRHRWARVLVGAALSFGVAHPVAARPYTAEEVLAVSVERSPELKAALADLEGARQAYLGEERARGWIFGASLQGQYNERFMATGQGATLNSNQNVNAGLSLSKQTTAGTRLGFGLQGSAGWQRTNRDLGTAEHIVLGPTYRADFSVDVTQPLLRGGGATAVLSRQRVAHLQERIAQTAKDEEASRVAQEVLVAYWNLWYAEHALGVERESLALVTRQRDEALARLKLGKIPQTDVLRLESQVAQAEQNVVAAEAQQVERQLGLARLMGLSPQRALEIETVGVPAMPPENLSLEELWERAKAHSHTLLKLEDQRQQTEERMQSARDAASAKLDLWASAGAGGIWSNNDVPPFSLPGGRPAFVGMVGLDYELPLGDSSADAELERARADLLAAEMRKQAREESLEEEVAVRLSALRTAQTRAQMATQMAEVAATLAEKEAEKLRLGTALVSEVISAQQSHREAELMTLRAASDVVLQALQLDHLTGQLMAQIALSGPSGE